MGPEGMYNSDSQKPAARQAINNFASQILKSLPVSHQLLAFQASFEKPRKPPPGGCWLNFEYKVQDQKVNPEDGRSYTLEAYTKLKEQEDVAPEKKFSKADIEKKWFYFKDACAQIERT